METVVRLDGAVGRTLERLIEMGYYKTKSEAIRAGILELEREYQVLQTPQELEAELVIKKIQSLEEQDRKGKIKWHTLDDVLKEAGIKRSDLR